MNFDDQDKEMMEIFKTRRGQKPPRSALQNFEEDVMDKIHRPKPFFGIGVMPVFILGFVLAAGLIYFGLQQRTSQMDVIPAPEMRTVQTVPEQPLQNPAMKPVTTISETVPEDLPGLARQSLAKISDADLDQASIDLLILQMLGEDEGLIEDIKMTEADMDTLIQLNAAMTATA